MPQNQLDPHLGVEAERVATLAKRRNQNMQLKQKLEKGNNNSNIPIRNHVDNPVNKTILSPADDQSPFI
jgi:hypothetical protein